MERIASFTVDHNVLVPGLYRGACVFSEAKPSSFSL